jgi:hypothetical protein
MPTPHRKQGPSRSLRRCTGVSNARLLPVCCPLAFKGLPTGKGEDEESASGLREWTAEPIPRGSLRGSDSHGWRRHHGRTGAEKRMPSGLDGSISK